MAGIAQEAPQNQTTSEGCVALGRLSFFTLAPVEIQSSPLPRAGLTLHANPFLTYTCLLDSLVTRPVRFQSET